MWLWLYLVYKEGRSHFDSVDTLTSTEESLSSNFNNGCTIACLSTLPGIGLHWGWILYGRFSVHDEKAFPVVTISPVRIRHDQ